MPSADILVIEDEPALRRLLTGFLRRQGHHVREAAGGREGIAAIKDAPPSLVILDLYMPTCDGLEVLRELRQHWPADWPFGVIVLTGSHDLPILDAALALGAFEVLLKPISMDELDVAVRTQLALKPPSEPP